MDPKARDLMARMTFSPNKENQRHFHGAQEIRRAAHVYLRPGEADDP